MNHLVNLPAAVLAFILTVLLQRWYAQREWIGPLLAGRLIAWRRRWGLTPVEAAKEISDFLGKKSDKPKIVDARTILRWESGKQPPHPQTYLQLLQLLESQPEEQVCMPLP